MIINKKCMKCGKPATHKFVRIEDNQVFDMYFCQEHAAEKSPYQKSPLPLSEILASFLNQEQSGQAAPDLESSVKCRTCGLSFGSYRKTLFLGCSDCYTSFHEQLLPELRKFHGSIRHAGRRPGGEKSAPESQGLIVPVESIGPQLVSVETPSKVKKALTAHSAKQTLAEIAELTAQMNKAIAEEDFERAALCRDQIKNLRGETGE